MQKFPLTMVLIASTVLASPVVLADDPQSSTADDQQRVTEFKGRPPFARKRAPADTVDLARFEDTAVADTTRRTDFRGRPPFARNAAPRASADFARFEEANADRDARRRVGPPGKMTSRR